MRSSPIPRLQIVPTQAGSATSQWERYSLVSCWRLLVAATRDKRLNRTDCAVLGAILDHIDRKTGRCDPKLTTIARRACSSVRSAPRSIAKLCELGYLRRTTGGRNRSNRYELGALSDQHGTDKLVSDVLVVDERVSDHPVSDTTERVALTNVSQSSVTGLSGDLALQENLPSEPTNALDVVWPPVGPDGLVRFAEFWAAYKRKEGSEKRAQEIWRSKNLDRIGDLIINDVIARAASDQWKSKQFIPYPATYLEHERWKDEWEPDRQRVPASSSSVSPCGLTAQEAEAENSLVLRRMERNASRGPP